MAEMREGRTGAAPEAVDSYVEASAGRPRIPGAATLRRSYRFMRRWPVIPVVIIAMLVVSAVFAEILAPHDPAQLHLRDQNTPPVWLEGGTFTYVMGTDDLGRDIMSRIIHGARISLIVAVVVLTAGAIIGTTLGLVSGYFGRLVDEFLMRLVDITLAIPFIFVALAVVIVFGQSLTIIIIILILFSWNAFARQVRAETLQLKTLDYVALSRISGASAWRIMFKHILPGVSSTLLVVTSLRVGQLILAESVLSFLGVGIPPPTPAWGVMIADGRDQLGSAWWIAFFPGMAIFLTVLAFNFLGDWMRDRFDPTLRQMD
ncbi:MAG: ABC transporter permease [Dehalococcoidia bacterium]